MNEDIDNCIKVLKAKGTIIYPTDTIWGLGCEATFEEAVEKVYEIKKRPADKSFIVLVNGLDMLDRYLRNIPAVALELIEMSDKPVTIVYDSPTAIAKNALAPDGTCAIRIVKDDFCVALMKRLGRPLISTSANYSGTPSPRNFSEIDKSLLASVDYVVKYKQQTPVNAKPSSIIKIGDNNSVKVIRK